MPKETHGSSFVGKWRMLSPPWWNSFTMERFHSWKKNQPDYHCFACKRDSSSPRALASKENQEGPSSLHFLRGSKSLQVLFHGLGLNQFFVFSSVSILMEGQYLLHLGSTGYIKIWEGRLPIVMFQLEGTACATQEDCSCITGILVLARG